jgi:hypothetical protein
MTHINYVRWSDADVERLLAMTGKVPPETIAKALGRTVESINAKLEYQRHSDRIGHQERRYGPLPEDMWHAYETPERQRHDDSKHIFMALAAGGFVAMQSRAHCRISA